MNAHHVASQETKTLRRRRVPFFPVKEGNVERGGSHLRSPMTCTIFPVFPKLGRELPELCSRPLNRGMIYLSAVETEFFETLVNQTQNHFFLLW